MNNFYISYYLFENINYMAKLVSIKIYKKKKIV